MMPQPGVTSTVQFFSSAARWINAWIKSALLEQQFLQKQGEVGLKMYVHVCIYIYIKQNKQTKKPLHSSQIAQISTQKSIFHGFHNQSAIFIHLEDVQKQEATAPS